MIIFFLTSCGQDIQGSYSGLVEGKEVTLQFKDDKQVLIVGYFPVPLVGTWMEEKTFGEPMIWISFDGPEEKPFRLRFELKAEGENFQLTGIKARPLGKGTKLNSIKIQGDPVFKKSS
ncbi:MAG: hypothetical protein HN489_09605 [Opitutae bacterium]|nr:hypothetical protein [Opitutae bacterium]